MDPEKKTAIVPNPLKALYEQSAPYLVVLEGPHAGRHLEVKEEPTVLGRGESSDVRLDDSGVSGRHCSVRRVGLRVHVEDHESTNGTFVDRVRIRGEAEVPIGGILHVGRTVLRHEILAKEEVQKKVRLTEDLRKAREYLLALLPPPLAEGPIRAEWRYIPSTDLAGDALGYHRLADGRLAFYLLDVCGHGVGPALHTASAVNLIRKESIPDVDFGCPDRVLDGLNRAFPMEDHGEMFLTIFYGVYDDETRELTYATGGHPPGLLRIGGRREMSRLITPNPPIGMIPDIEFAVDTTRVEEGSRLYVFTDGLFEVKTPEGEMGLDGFVDLVGEPPRPDIPETLRIEETLRARMVSPAFEDDFSLLVLEFFP